MSDDDGRELEDAKQRLQRDADRAMARAVRQVVAVFVPTLDDLDRAVDAAAAHEAESVGQGLALIQRDLLARLADLGVRRIDPTGEPFDPRLHEAVTTIEVAEPARVGRVVTTLAAGYVLAGEVVRPARVAVGRLSVRA